MIRELVLSEKEINRIMEIWLESVISGHPFIPETFWQAEYENVRNDYLPKSQTFVYEEEGEIKGFISLIGHEYIGALFVAVDHQKQGIGKKLMAYVKGKQAFLKLAVYCPNSTAVDFYKKSGFHIDSIEKNEDTGVDNYIMAWKGDLPN